MRHALLVLPLLFFVSNSYATPYLSINPSPVTASVLKTYYSQNNIGNTPSEDEKQLDQGDTLSNHIIRQEHIKVRLGELMQSLTATLEDNIDSALSYSVDNFQNIQLYGFLLFIYLLPSVIALFRNHPAKFLIYLANIFLGWFVVVWALTLIHATRKELPR